MFRIRKNNRKPAESVIRRIDPAFRQRWEVYDSILERLTGPEVCWLDAGCGSNLAIEEFPCAINVGIDRYRHPEVLHNAPNHFVMGTLDKLPFRDSVLSLITLNTVVEHIPNPSVVFSEIFRVLRPGGHVLIHTTNIHSPLIFLGKLIPRFMRNHLFTSILGANQQDMFKVYHKINTLNAFKKVKGFDLEEFHAVQDLNWTNLAVFFCLLVYQLFTKLPGLWRLRTNMIVLLRKNLTD